MKARLLIAVLSAAFLANAWAIEPDSGLSASETQLVRTIEKTFGIRNEVKEEPLWAPAAKVFEGTWHEISLKPYPTALLAERDAALAKMERKSHAGVSRIIFQDAKTAKAATSRLDTLLEDGASGKIRRLPSSLKVGDEAYWFGSSFVVRFGTLLVVVEARNSQMEYSYEEIRTISSALFAN
jgi:hypothetical protein